MVGIALPVVKPHLRGLDTTTAEFDKSPPNKGSKGGGLSMKARLIAVLTALSAVALFLAGGGSGWGP
jgi:hypothetical protein